MSLTISMEEAQATLAELIGKLRPGEEVVITKDDQPVAELRSLIGNGFLILPIEPRHTAVLTTLPFHHRDPFVRQVELEGVTRTDDNG